MFYLLRGAFPFFFFFLSTCRCCSQSALIYHCCIVVVFFFKHHKNAISAQPKNLPRNNSGLFSLTQIPWDAASETCEMAPFIGRGVNWKQNVSGAPQTRRALCKILLRLDRWFEPVMITSIKHSSKLHHPSLEAEYAWRLAQIPYCEIITQQKDCCALELWQDLKFFFFLFFFLAR